LNRILEQVHVSESDETGEVDYQTSEYLSSIVSAATLAPAGVVIDTAILCRRRPFRKKCSGRIKARLQENPAELKWWCPQCSDHGFITNWKGTPKRISHFIGNNRIKKNKCCRITLSKPEFDLLNEISIVNPATASIVHGAIIENNAITLIGGIEGWDSLIGYIAFEANHESKPRRRLALNKLFEKIKQAI